MLYNPRRFYFFLILDPKPIAQIEFTQLFELKPQGWGNMTKKLVCAAATLLCLLLAVNGFGQSINASVGGTVADPSKALIPGVTITATNTGTGIANTTVTNESGAYNFPALQPGTYKLSAELPGFQTQTFTDVQLGGDLRNVEAAHLQALAGRAAAVLPVKLEVTGPEREPFRCDGQSATTSP